MARILVVGSGVVGQATGKGFAAKGHSISYVDINPHTIARLQAEGLHALTIAELDWNAVDLVMLAVSTPSLDGTIVLDYIEAAALDIGRGLARTSNFVAVVLRFMPGPLLGFFTAGYLSTLFYALSLAAVIRLTT